MAMVLQAAGSHVADCVVPEPRCFFRYNNDQNQVSVLKEFGWGNRKQEFMVVVKCEGSHLVP